MQTRLDIILETVSDIIEEISKEREGRLRTDTKNRDRVLNKKLSSIIDGIHDGRIPRTTGIKRIEQSVRRARRVKSSMMNRAFGDKQGGE